MANIRINSDPVINLKNLGWTEMLIALLPILGAYYLGPVPFSFWILLLLSVVSIARKRRVDFNSIRPLVIFIIYYTVHEFIIAIVADGFNLNKRIEQFLFLFSIILITPIIDLKKLSSSLNLVTIICIIGVLSQMVTLMRGGSVHPIEIPGLQMSEERLMAESNRPSSYFMEPAAYTAYMYAPLMLSLLNRKYWWSAIIGVSMLLTGSTTAIFTVFIILGAYVITQGAFRKSSIVVIIIAGVLLYALSNYSVFDVGVEKFDNTDYENNVRIVQGPIIVSTMLWHEMIFGVPFGDAIDYYYAGRTIGTNVAIYGSGIYMSTTWMLIFKFGIVGLLLYLNIFYRLAKRCRAIIPYIICLVVTMFSASMGIGVTYAYTMMVLYVIAAQYKPIDKSNKLTIK